MQQFRDTDEPTMLELIKSHKNKTSLNICDTKGNTLFIYALHSHMKSVAMEILNTPELRMFNIYTGPTTGCTALIECILYGYDDDEDLAIKILEQPSTCGIDDLNIFGMYHRLPNSTWGNTYLYCAITKKKYRTVCKLLEHPEFCQINMGLGLSGETPFLEACDGSTTEIAMEIFKIGDKSIQCNCDNTGLFPIMAACKHGMSEVALAILNHTNNGIDKIPNFNYKNTCLIEACLNCTEEVVLKMLETHEKCGVRCSMHNNILFKTYTAFTVAHEKNFTRVTDFLLTHYTIPELLGISNENYQLFEKYSNHLQKFIDNLPNKDYINENLALFNKITGEVINRSPVKSCLLCGEDQKSNVVYINCKHIISMCTECTDKLYTINNRCPVCRVESNIIKDAYIVNE